MKAEEGRWQLTAPKLLLALVLGLVVGFGAFFGPRFVKAWWAGIPRIRIGDDFIEGTPRNDVITGPDRPMTISGGAGDDQITAGNQDDFINGGPGNDQIAGGEGSDFINGDEGDDTLNGGPGDDSLNGGEGNDTIDGEEGVDFINGDEGSDTIILGPDATTDASIDAGPDNDTIIIYAGSVAPNDLEDVLCGEGMDRVVLRGFPKSTPLKFPVADPNGGTYINTAEDCEMVLAEP